jgi:hypothetical protein
MDFTTAGIPQTRVSENDAAVPVDAVAVPQRLLDAFSVEEYDQLCDCTTVADRCFLPVDSLRAKLHDYQIIMSTLGLPPLQGLAPALHEELTPSLSADTVDMDIPPQDVPLRQCGDDDLPAQAGSKRPAPARQPGKKKRQRPLSVEEEQDDRGLLLYVCTRAWNVEATAPTLLCTSQVAHTLDAGKQCRGKCGFVDGVPDHLRGVVYSSPNRALCELRDAVQPGTMQHGKCAGINAKVHLSVAPGDRTTLLKDITTPLCGLLQPGMCQFTAEE